MAVLPTIVCDLARYSAHACPRLPTFKVTNSEGETYGTCGGHAADTLTIMAPSAPLMVEPIFDNWGPVRARREAQATS